MKELERYKKAMEVARIEFENNDKISSAAYAGFWGIINSILNPPPEMETVTVERWECGCCGFTYKTEPTGKCLHPRENHMDPSETTYIKLTGTFQRPKPQPVERSVSVEAHVVNGTGAFVAGSILSMDNCPLLESFPECHSKTGTLTFTWID